jgi:hypothetical protein
LRVALRRFPSGCCSAMMRTIGIWDSSLSKRLKGRA